MPSAVHPPTPLRIGVDVGGTFTDLVAFDADSGDVSVLKLPSTPPDFHLAVIEAVRRAAADRSLVHVVHGSTVATNALLQRGGEPIAFVTTDGFRDMLLIGRQDRPSLYALRVTRPRPLAEAEHCFTVRERIDAAGNVVEPLDERDVERAIAAIRAAGLRHVAVCFLFSFVNPSHERRFAARCAAAGLTTTLSSELVPEFREYERASTTAVNASLRPVVEAYLAALARGLAAPDAEHAPALRIMHSAGGTLAPAEAATSAARLVLSGPAGGVIGAAAVARAAGVPDAITYDMGGTSTDVSTILAGDPQWTSSSTIDGLPVALPAFDIHTVGAGGGSIAHLDPGGALRVGPRSAGARPGPACYARGGTEPTVTDANVLLGRIVPDDFAGGALRVDVALAGRALEPLAAAMNKPVDQAALGIVRVAESNMAHAVRAVTSRRGLDPRDMSLLSFGGAGGLHACAIAESLEVSTVVVPPYCGVLSALGMVVAPPVVDVSQSVLHLATTDAVLREQFEQLLHRARPNLSDVDTDRDERYADVRFRGQSYEVRVAVGEVSRDRIGSEFHRAYEQRYGSLPSGREVEVVTLRLRRIGQVAPLRLPRIRPTSRTPTPIRLTDAAAVVHDTFALRRTDLLGHDPRPGPHLIVDPEATVYVPGGWTSSVRPDGTVFLRRR